MKKIMLLLAMQFTGTILVSAQNAELMKWVNSERQAVQKEKTTKETTKEKIDGDENKPSKNLYIALGVGYTSDKYVPLDFYLNFSAQFVKYRTQRIVTNGHPALLYIY